MSHQFWIHIHSVPHDVYKSLTMFGLHIKWLWGFYTYVAQKILWTCIWILIMSDRSNRCYETACSRHFMFRTSTSKVQRKLRTVQKLHRLKAGRFLRNRENWLSFFCDTIKRETEKRNRYTYLTHLRSCYIDAVYIHQAQCRSSNVGLPTGTKFMLFGLGIKLFESFF